MKMNFRDIECTVKFARYQDNDRTAIQLIDEQGMPYATATVNLPDVEMDDDVVVIKNYSENIGMLDALMQAGIVEEVVGYTETGLVQVPLCRLSARAIRKAA